ncbi:hypothetical protein IMSAGC020_02602 [Lachnospiraceae bacterium]|nr:hypothetical protein IMSAGC020_02602 [Lachnospiraceae bacterium]
MTQIFVSGSSSLSLSSTSLYASVNTETCPVDATMSLIPYERNSTWGAVSTAFSICPSILVSSVSHTPELPSAVTRAFSSTPCSYSPWVMESPITNELANFSPIVRFAHASSAARSSSSNTWICPSITFTSNPSISLSRLRPSVGSSLGFIMPAVTTRPPIMSMRSMRNTDILRTTSLSSLFLVVFALSLPTKGHHSSASVRTSNAYMTILYCFSL